MDSISDSLVKEYSKKLKEYMDGELSKKDWIAYCQQIMSGIVVINKPKKGE